MDIIFVARQLVEKARENMIVFFLCYLLASKRPMIQLLGLPYGRC